MNRYMKGQYPIYYLEDLCRNRRLQRELKDVIDDYQWMADRIHNIDMSARGFTDAITQPYYEKYGITKGYGQQEHYTNWAMCKLNELYETMKSYYGVNGSVGRDKTKAERCY